MKKFLFYFLLSTIVTFSNCNYFSGIEEDPVTSNVINIIKSSKLTGTLYCDKSNYFMVYYWKSSKGLQIGLSYQVPSIQNGVPNKRFYEDSKKIYQQIKKNFKGEDINFRMYIYTNTKTYQYGSIFIDKDGKEHHYSNENNRNTYLEGTPFPGVAITGPRNGIFSSYKGWSYTEDIIY